MIAAADKTGTEINDRLKAVLAMEPYFPKNEALIRHFIHLTRMTKIEEREEDRPILSTGSLKPGDWVMILKGEFKFGDDKRPVTIEYDYDIDAFPVTQQQYQEFVNATGHDLPLGVLRSGPNRIAGIKMKKPFPMGWTTIPWSWFLTRMPRHFCQWRTEKEGRTVRLPTEEEWEKAARGIDGREYPWGEEFDKEKCNTKESGIRRIPLSPNILRAAAPMMCTIWSGTSGSGPAVFNDGKDIWCFGAARGTAIRTARCADRAGSTRTTATTISDFVASGLQSNPLPFNPFTLCKGGKSSIMAKEIDAITRLYDFILWMIPKLEKFPRSQKFLLGDRIETLMLEILELLIEAAYSRQKQTPCGPPI